MTVLENLLSDIFEELADAEHPDVAPTDVPREPLPGYTGRLGAPRPAFYYPDAYTVDIAPGDQPGYFAPPKAARFDGGAFFAAGGHVYALTRAPGGDWQAAAVSGGLGAPQLGRTQADAIRAVWDLTESHFDVNAPFVEFRDARGLYGLPEKRAVVTCQGHTISLKRRHKVGHSPWVVPCGKCGGTGTLEHYRHVKGGVCFGCDGDGISMSYTLEDAVALVRTEARKERTDANKRALAAERERRRWLRFTQAHGQVARWIDFASSRGHQKAAKWRAAVLKGRELTADQVQAARDALGLERDEAEVAAYAEVERRAAVKRSRPAGVKGERVSVSGVVTVLRSYETGPHYRRRVGWRVVVQAPDGLSVIAFTTPAKVKGLAEGDAVTVVGTVKDPENRVIATGELQTVLRLESLSTAV
ncbi:hypothetical protein AB0O47_39125 [Streptomyces noursei]|uniref:hypothetical protein n=1 Tax=Streptomyces noursei TaxID=1971 RepID=UPI00344D45C6